MRLVPTRYRPDTWFVCFREESPWWPARLVTWGKWKHVACYGFVPGQRLWLMYEYTFRSIAICVGPENGSNDLLNAMDRDALVVMFRARRSPRRWWSPIATCTTNVASIIGSESRALRPDRFLRDLLKEGGEVILEPGQRVTGTETAAAGRTG